MKKKFCKIGLVFVIGVAIIGINFSNINAQQAYLPKHFPEYWALFFVPDPLWLNWWEDLNITKEILLANGWNENHFIELKGSDATRSILFNEALPELALKEDWTDTTLIFIFAHGTTGNGGSFEDYDGSLIEYSDLNVRINQLSFQSEGMGFIIHACHSETAIDDLMEDGRVIVTSCGNLIEVHQGFGKYFALALDVFGDYDDLGNQNGVGSLEEAFEVTKDEVWSSYLPAISDCYPTEENSDSELHVTFQNWEDGRVDKISTKVFHQYSDTDGYEEVRKFDGEDSAVAQRFELEYDYLTKLQLVVTSRSYPDSPLVVSIRENLGGLDDGDIIYASVNSQDIDEYKEYVTFDFGEGMEKQQDDYYIVCRETEEETQIANLYRIWMDQDHYGKSQHFAYDWESPDPYIPWESIDDNIWDFYLVTYGKGETQNQPPYIPKRPLGPDLIERNRNYAFYVKTIDVEGDDIHYQIDWGDNERSDWEGPYSSNEVVGFNHMWDINDLEDRYYVKVRAKDSSYIPTEKDWSDVLTVDIINLKS